MREEIPFSETRGQREELFGVEGAEGAEFPFKEQVR